MFALIAILAAPTLIFAGWIWSSRLLSYAVDVRRVRRARSRAVGAPIEQLAADLRRLRPAQAMTGRSRTRREAAFLAYTDLLADACRRLEIPQDLAGRTGPDRELETIRIEAALADAGLDVAG